MSLREQSFVGRFPELCFPVFRGAGARGVSKPTSKKNCFFPFGPVLLVLIIVIKIIIIKRVRDDGKQKIVKIQRTRKIEVPMA